MRQDLSSFHVSFLFLFTIFLVSSLSISLPFWFIPSSWEWIEMEFRSEVRGKGQKKRWRGWRIVKLMLDGAQNLVLFPLSPSFSFPRDPHLVRHWDNRYREGEDKSHFDRLQVSYKQWGKEKEWKMRLKRKAIKWKERNRILFLSRYPSKPFTL